MKFYDFHLHFRPSKEWLERLDLEKACMIGKVEEKYLLQGEEIEATSKQELRKKVRESEADFIILKKAPNEIVQYAIQEGVVDCVTGLEKGKQHVPLLYRNPGFNQVMAKAAAENQVAIDFNFRNIRKTEGEKRSRLLARMKQNLKICKKYGSPIILSSGAETKWEMVPAYDLVGFGQVLGLTKGEAKKALNEFQQNFLEEV